MTDALTEKHVHTDECWEPGSGCDMGRSDKYAVSSNERLSDARLTELLELYNERAALPNCGVKEDIDVASALRELQELRSDQPEKHR